ncbi:MAG: protein kinase [Planctomycetota bacterium]|nr:protein kinase [Planctomycetota bacterium]
MAQLKVTLAGKSECVPLPEKGSLVGGKDTKNSLPLNATGASRRHFRIGKLKDGGWAIEDLGSTNGTILNGKKVKRARLSHGDVVQIGIDCKLVFEDAPTAPKKKGVAPVALKSRTARLRKPGAKSPRPRKTKPKNAKRPAPEMPTGVEEVPLAEEGIGEKFSGESTLPAPEPPGQDTVDIASDAMLKRLLGTEGALEKLHLEGKKITFGPYVIEERLQAGGMGVVVKALNPRLQMRVALKVLHPEMVDEKNVGRFKQEAWAISAFNHVNIVQVRDLGKHGDMHYIAMDFVEGENLLPVSIRRDLSYWQIVEIVYKLADVLRLLHSRNIWHRDIKPQNVMLQKDGEIKLIDFGIATLERERDDALETGEGLIMGTPAFISPEQVRGGKKAPVDGRSDLYSLGALMYFMLTGRRPFSGKTAVEILRRNLNEDPPHPHDIDEMIPPGLISITQRLMRKDPDERFDSAESLMSELDKWRKSSQGKSARDRHQKLQKVRAMKAKKGKK